MSTPLAYTKSLLELSGNMIVRFSIDLAYYQITRAAINLKLMETMVLIFQQTRFNHDNGPEDHGRLRRRRHSSILYRVLSGFETGNGFAGFSTKAMLHTRTSQLFF